MVRDPKEPFGKLLKRGSLKLMKVFKSFPTGDLKNIGIADLCLQAPFHALAGQAAHYDSDMPSACSTPGVGIPAGTRCGRPRLAQRTSGQRRGSVTLYLRRFGIRYHHDHVGRFLSQRLGWTPQKPRRVARERDEEAILRWQSEQFPRIARAAQRRGAHLVFLDESGFMLNPSLRRTWAPKGRTPVLDAWDRRDRISAISNSTLSPKARRLNLHFDLMPDNTIVHAEDIVAYLRQLKAQFGGPMTELWDGSNLHDRSKLVRAFLAEHPDIMTERLPAYAPELNPDELVWAWTNYGRLGNVAANNSEWLRDYLITEMCYLRQHPELLASFIDHTEIPLKL